MATPVKALLKRILGVHLSTKDSIMIVRLSCVIIGLGIITLRWERISLKTLLNSWVVLIYLLMLVIRIGGWMYWDLFLYLIVLLNISKNGIKQGNHIG